MTSFCSYSKPYHIANRSSSERISLREWLLEEKSVQMPEQIKEKVITHTSIHILEKQWYSNLHLPELHCLYFVVCLHLLLLLTMLVTFFLLLFFKTEYEKNRDIIQKLLQNQ